MFLVNFDFTYRAAESLGPPGQPSLSPHNSDHQSTHCEFCSNRFSSGFGSPGALRQPPREVLTVPKMILIPASVCFLFPKIAGTLPALGNTCPSRVLFSKPIRSGLSSFSRLPYPVGKSSTIDECILRWWFGGFLLYLNFNQSSGTF